MTAFAATFHTEVDKMTIQGFTNLLRVGQSVHSLPDNASTTDKVIAWSEEDGRVGGIILIVVSVAAPKAPATPEQGARVVADVGKNRVELPNASKVDAAEVLYG